jgi:hypothetical protein
MDGLVITLKDDGSFQMTDGPLTASVTYEPETPTRPWILSTLRNEGKGTSQFATVAVFGSLDDAMIEMVKTVAEGRDWIKFMVSLPCGASFTRPGHVPAENVMASLGWVHVKTLVAHVVRSYNSGFTAEDVADIVDLNIKDESIEVGTAVDVGTFNGQTNWCIDLHRNCHEFLRCDAISDAVSKAFDGLLHGGQPLYDFFPTYPIRKTTAQIVSFPDRMQQTAA